VAKREETLTLTAEAVGISTVIDRRPLGSFQKGIVGICACIAFLEGFGVQNAGFVAPALARSFHLGHNALGLFFSLGLLGLMLGALILAPLADHLGRKPVLLLCVVLFGLGSIGQALAPSERVLYPLRFLTLFGIGGAMPNTIAMTSEYSPARIRSQTIVLMFNGFIAGAVAVGLIAARMVEALGWRSILIVGGVLPVLLIPVLLLRLPESVRFLASRGATSTQARARLATLMRRIDPSIAPDAHFVLGEHAPGRVSVTALFKEGRSYKTILLWTLSFCSLLDLFLMSNWLPTQIASLGVSVGIAILIGALLQLGGMASIVLAWTMHRIGPATTLAAAYLIGALSIACIALAGSSVPLLTLSVLAAGFGVLGGQTAANAVAAESYPTEIRATGVGWFFGVGRSGSIVGPSIAGFLLSIGVSNRHVFMLAVIPAAIAAIASLGLGQRR
jgi:AAHS family 4-hydroxybenzoate transporter-like MFS transporter